MFIKRFVVRMLNVLNHVTAVSTSRSSYVVLADKLGERKRRKTVDICYLKAG